MVLGCWGNKIEKRQKSARKTGREKDTRKSQQPKKKKKTRPI
jgi:hypothetical protein